MAELSCPACASSRVDQMDSVGPVPVLCGSLWESQHEALATPTAHLDLSVCLSCAHVWNTTFDPSLVDYDAKYDNALDFSPTFRQYTGGLVDHLVDTFDLHGKRVAEIGSGKGEFLRQLCGAGGNAGVGYDPTYEGPDRDGDIEFVRAFFSLQASPRELDFVCCRHVLEHLADPVEFLLDIRAAVKDEPVPMYFEVPNAEFNFAESGPWDLIYPHVAYFSETSLRALLERAGFRVDRLEPCFNAQFLGAEVVVHPSMARSSSADTARGELLSRRYAGAMEQQLVTLVEWRDRLSRLRGQGPVGLWGAGSKGVTFLSLVDPARTLETVVDVNPRKWGRYLPGGGHEVVGPVEVRHRTVRSVLVMNSAYVHEIERAVAECGARAQVLPV